MNIKNLVFVKNDKLITTSNVIANGVKKEHKTVINLITKYKKEISHFGILNTDIKKNKKGHPTEFYYLNEEQTTLLITLMRNDPKNNIIINFKIDIIDEFFRMRKILLNLSMQKVNQEWLENRSKGKISRLKETNTIKIFIEYAKMQGSKNAEKYYITLTNMENKALFLIEQKFKNLREVLNINQLDEAKQADEIVLKALNDGMENKMHYKDIYKLAKKRVELFASLKGKSVVPSIEFKQIKDKE